MAPSRSPKRAHDPLMTPVAAPNGRLAGGGRGSERGKSTPFHAAAPALLMLEPSNATSQVCVQVGMSLRVRPVSATAVTLGTAAASSRPLAIVVETSKPVDEERVADVAFAVGALIVRVSPGESAEAVEQRLRGALEASMRLRHLSEAPAPEGETKETS